MQKVLFTVTELIDKRNWGSSLQLDKEYIGTYDGKAVWWMDPMNDQEWVFYDNDTCKIINYIH